MDPSLDEGIIRVEGISKFYKNTQALKEISFQVKKGEVFGLIGPDGAGKTTLIQILAGILTPTSGKVFIKDIDVLKEPEATREIIGYMPQGLGLNLYDTLTVEENINFFKNLRLLPERVFQENKEILLEITGLKPFLNRPAGALSGGMRQKLALVLTLLHLPEIILLDEPTTGVDPLSRYDFWRIIHQLVKERGITVLLTTSYMDEAERCHRIALMHQGRFLLEDLPENISDLEASFIEKITGARPKALPRKRETFGKPVVICQEVSKDFNGFKAVDKVTFEIREGEIFGLLGPNGAGKTTLIKMMCGLLEISEGDIFIKSISVKKERSRVWNKIGYMSQRFSLYRDLTVLENLKLYAGLYEVKGLNFEELLQKLGLLSFKNLLVKDLPFGIRQRVALACAILHQPSLLFLDEPTSGVDPVARKAFWELIYQLSMEGTTIIVSTHYMDEAENCHRLALMNRGKVVALGSPEELKKKSERLFGVLLQIKTPHYHKAYELLENLFPGLTLYGRRIFARTFDPESTKEKISQILREAQISEFVIEKRDLPFQEVFVAFIKRSKEHV